MRAYETEDGFAVNKIILSNIEAILLSIVREKPSYAYEINKVIEYRNLRMWVRVGVASIYQVLKRLEENGLVISHNERDGRMPDRKRYYITDSGKTALTETSKRLLSNLEWFYLDLNVGLEASNALTPREMAQCLTKRLAKVKTNINRVKEISISDREARFKKKAIIKNLTFLRESEEAFLQEVLREMSVGIDE
ncbi:Transcriptional regulator PadR-like family protein [Pelotomaculum schinkii]|uniref:Transcriptional regulator PadR-like family protein n=1 Tax=Pelotomaculum schinkii TaxID=78350 RepID=A0A4Y7RGH9_9FIRM|nr:PadR family transcriptional regulator [Pelotomaculum schinkii]TEB07893.1 Transcriptional regulator PadR-like family protein [Pelotomaculum schinkii]